MWIDDRILEKADRSLFLRVWGCEKLMVVCGRSNKPESECNLEVCQQDGVDVLQRYGGGGTVLLHEGCSILSLGLWVDDYYKNDLFFSKINQAVIQTLAQIDTKFLKLSQNGISDIVLGKQKVAGTSMFRSRHYLLYQASLLVDAKPELIEKYLKHPTIEPDYRENRSHSNFVLGLNEIKSNITVDETNQVLSKHLSDEIEKTMGSHFIAPDKKHIPKLLEKIKRES